MSRGDFFGSALSPRRDGTKGQSSGAAVDIAAVFTRVLRVSSPISGVKRVKKRGFVALRIYDV